SAPGAPAKMVILGFDGVDAKMTQKWMDEGKLPNLARLRASGTYAPLLSTIPSQTPVSWSTFSTGLSPGRHGIFDFLKRDPAPYRPGFAAFDAKEVPCLWGSANGWGVGALAGLVVVLLVAAFGLLRRARVAVLAALALVLGAAAGVGCGIGADRLL